MNANEKTLYAQQLAKDLGFCDDEIIKAFVQELIKKYGSIDKAIVRLEHCLIDRQTANAQYDGIHA